MRRTEITIASITLLLMMQLGCDTFNTSKIDNPVVGPPPPRLTMTNETPSAAGTAYVQNSLEMDGGSSQPSTIMPVSLSNNSGGLPVEFSENQVVATVNGSPIFASEILERYSKQIAAAKSKMSAKDLQQAKLQLIQRDLKSHVERKMLVLALKSTLSKKQIESINEQLDIAFEQDTERLKKEMKVDSLLEVAAKLNQQGTSLAHLKEAFIHQQLAMEYLRAKSKVNQKIGRQDMLEYYKDHIEDYSHVAKSRWQQISVSFSKHGGKQEALQHLNKAVKELQARTDFGAIAKKYSDGPEAYRGGKWDWIQRGSLADEQLEKAVFELPVGMISQVIVSDTSYTLVKVINRTEAGAKPFKELQSEIKKKIEKEAFEVASKKTDERSERIFYC